MRPSRSADTLCHVVGLGVPERFADGAARGTPHAFKKEMAIGWCGIRTPIVDSPAVAISGTECSLGNTTVSGPGKKCSMNFSADRGTRLARSARSAMPQCER